MYFSRQPTESISLNLRNPTVIFNVPFLVLLLQNMVRRRSCGSLHARYRCGGDEAWASTVSQCRRGSLAWRWARLPYEAWPRPAGKARPHTRGRNAPRSQTLRPLETGLTSIVGKRDGRMTSLHAVNLGETTRVQANLSAAATSRRCARARRSFQSFIPSRLQRGRSHGSSSPRVAVFHGRKSLLN